MLSWFHSRLSIFHWKINIFLQKLILSFNLNVNLSPYVFLHALSFYLYSQSKTTIKHSLLHNIGQFQLIWLFRKPLKSLLSPSQWKSIPWPCYASSWSRQLQLMISCHESCPNFPKQYSSPWWNFFSTSSWSHTLWSLALLQ